MCFPPIAAIVSEVGRILSLHVATHGSKRWHLPVAVGYLVTFISLALTLQAGMGFGAAYRIWAALGVALTAVASRVLFKEPPNWVMTISIVRKICGVLLVETGGSISASHAQNTTVCRSAERPAPPTVSAGIVADSFIPHP